MREIKFRYTFKRKEDGHLYQIIVPLGIFEDGHGEIFSMLKNEFWEIAARDQFTGLFDAKGGELFDQDLIVNASRNGGKPHPIIFDETQAAWCGDYGLKYPLHSSELKETIKVGNVCEHPHLLQGKA